MGEQAVEELDTFEDGSYSGEETNYESFDDMDTGFEGKGRFDDEEDEGQSSEDSTVQAKEGEEIDEDSQVNLLEDQEEKRDEKAEEDAPDKDEKSKEGDEESDDIKSDEDDAAKDDGDSPEEIRNIKAFRDDKAYEIPEDAEIGVKVAGKSEKVSIKDLRDNYSGKVVWEEKFGSLDEDRKAFDSNKVAYEEEINSVRDKMGAIRDLVSKGQAGEAHPLEGFNYLLDLMGVNSVQYNKQMQEQMFEEYDIFSEMSDAEKDLYWSQKENKYLVDKQESEKSNVAATQAQTEQQQRITEIREAHGVNEDDFDSAYQELLDQGNENITAELVVQVAQLTPLMEIGETILSKYTDQLTTDEKDSMVREVAKMMHENPEFTKEEMESLVAEELEVETLVSEISSTKKAPEILKHKSSKTAEQKYEYESFDDWD